MLSFPFFKMDLKEIRLSGMDWIDVAQDRDLWKALLSIAMNRQFHKMLGNFFKTERLTASQGLSLMWFTSLITILYHIVLYCFVYLLAIMNMECLTRFIHLRITICLCTCFSEPFGDVLKGSVPQIDIAPTLSMLLGLPIPTTSTGKMIPELLHSIPVSQQLYALYYNCKQVATQFENQISSSPTQGDLKLFYKFRHLKLCVN
jgi:hypothetical protein